MLDIKVHDLDLPSLLKRLPVRPSDAHKGHYGHVLVVGGDFGYPGAPVLAALGALRVGAGLVTVATHRYHLVGLNSTHPEIMCCAIDTPELLHAALEKATVVVLGPGLGRSSWSAQVYNICTATALPLILDADGLYFLAQNPSQNTNRILTPHPGEAATLLNTKLDNSARLEILHRLIKMYQSTVVLKGSGSLIGSAKTEIGICNAGNPGMASGGMGDLLSGIIGGLVAQKLDLDYAAKLGVCLHATAGDIAAKSGQRGIIATDLLLQLKSLLN